MNPDKSHMTEIAKPVEFDPFGDREIVRVAPAVEPQLEIWVSCAIGGADANRSYNESVSLLLEGAFDQSAMERSLQDLIQRHEGLRSAFSADGSQICIYKDVPLNMVYSDLSSKNDSQQKQFIDDFKSIDASTAFDLLNGPLFRFALFKLNENEHYFTLTAHHIICDGWSVGIMLQDLSKFYSGYAKDNPVSLPDAFPFSQYAEDQWAFYQSKAYAEIELYWVDQYKDHVPQLNMPIDFPRPTLRTYKSQRDDYSLDSELVSAIKKIGAKAGSSLVTTLLSAFEILLYRLTGQEEIVLGLPAAGQSASGHHALVGHCVHLLPLRSHPHDDLTFNEYIKERKNKIFDDYDHQEFTFGSLLKKLNIPRDPSRVPLVPVVFNMDLGLDDGVAFEGLKHQLFYNARAYENFELSLNASGSEKSLVLEWSYNTRLFKPDTIRSMMEEFEKILRVVVKDPEIRIKDIPSKQAKQFQIPTSSGGYPEDKTIVDLFSEQARITPDRTAILFENTHLTYRELDEISNQLGHYLQKKGMKTETLVPVCIERSVNSLVGILGILKAGAAYVPIDPEYPAERISFMLDDTAAKLIVTSRNCSDKIPPSEKRELVLLEDAWDKILQQPTTAPAKSTGFRGLAYVIYTSGSTGKPKGVMIEQRNVVSLVKATDYVKLSEKDVLLSTGSPSFDATTFEYWGMLLNGGQLVICSEQTLLNATLLKEEIGRKKVNIMWFTSSLLNQWIDLDIGIFEGLKTILAGGEKLSEKHIEKLRSAYPGLAIINGYGPTENTTFSLTYPIKEKEISHAIPIGRPLSNRTAYVLNPKQQLCATGTVGELFVGGAGVGRGYLNQPELTCQKFLPDPFSSEKGAKMYRTGDMARCLSDGNIEFLGRIDDQVKIRGFRIELGEIEHVLQQYRGIKHAVVVAKEDKENDKRLIGYIVPNGEFNKDGIVSFLQSKLPAYMVPRLFIELNKIPLTSNGKLDKKALPDPDLLPGYGRKKNREPQTDVQKLIAGIWTEALKLRNISIDDDFFELGGHSLIAVKVMKSIEEKTGQRLPITALFEAPTIEKLSFMLDKDEKSISWKSLVPIKPDGNKPPLYIVHGSGLTVLVFHSLAKGLDVNQPVYGLQARGLNGVDEPFETMEDIAAYYISEILEQNPDGPYNLAGYSFGGIVAFEMAKQLEAMGKLVNMLAIFDTYADNSAHFDDWLIKMSKKFRRQFPKFKFILLSLVKNPGKTIAYQLGLVNYKVNRLLAPTGLVEKQLDEDEHLEHSDKINRKHDIAFEKYKMSPYNGTIDLFRVKNRMYYLDDPIYLGWKPFALQGLNIHEISGDHKTFLLYPNVQELARLLKGILNERNRGKQPRQEYTKPAPVLKEI